MEQKTFQLEIESEKRNDICPLCLKEKKHKITRMVKSGYTVIDETGGYRFIQTGWHEVKDEYWTCKRCTKKVPTKEYNMKLVEMVNSGYKI